MDCHAAQPHTSHTQTATTGIIKSLIVDTEATSRSHIHGLPQTACPTPPLPNLPHYSGHRQDPPSGQWITIALSSWLAHEVPPPLGRERLVKQLYDWMVPASNLAKE